MIFLQIGVMKNKKQKINKKRKPKTYDHKYMSKLGFNPLTSKRKWSW